MISGRIALKTPSRPKMVLTETFSFRGCRNLSKKAQFGSVPLPGWASREDGLAIVRFNYLSVEYARRLSKC